MQKATLIGGFCGRNGNRLAQSGAVVRLAVAANLYDIWIYWRRESPKNFGDLTFRPRFIAASPPADWPLQRQQEYFDWAQAVIDGLRGIHQTLKRIFDEAYKRRP